MGPSQHVSDSSRHQEEADVLCGRRYGRLRRCLLKGCGRLFRPQHPCSRYCSPSCSEAAGRWSRWRACWRYRRTEAGRERRREQAGRYRERLKAKQAPIAKTEASSGEGHRYATGENFSPCSRPGCYEVFPIAPRSPCQKFCSCLCRQALRVVLLRERRYRHNRTCRGGLKAIASARAP